MIHEYLLKYVIYVIHGYYTPSTAARRYHVPNSNILQVVTTLEPTQEQRDTHLLEPYNKQHIFIWVRNNLNLPLVQGHGYTDGIFVKNSKG